MIKSELVDGFKGDGHVEVEQLGDINIGTYGPDDYVLETGKQLQAQVITNNKVRIFDGVMVIQGRRDVIAANAYTDVPIDNGAQGVKRNDIIVRRYTKDSASEIENTEFAVIKGTPGAAATDPVVTVGNIRNGDTLHNMKLYRVRIEGLNIVGVDKLYKTNMSLSTLNSNLTALNNNLGYELGS
ncbi:hypothetical protein NE683_15255, partial [Bariatricus massiliensis]|nr:hypothetical protein [Bariatricus massiliensis]MCB7375415.1 hypothetical protein [Bariatricus massiliensis]MCB7412036.1 hypothetical protein [Bariatricus massiliensis]MCQ5254583.1 hypothetical protein [Bariatricus massiliensis]